MIAVLREVGANMRAGVIQRADFKVVYVAPMKALAAEVTASFSKRLKPLGLSVRELTGDMQLTKKEMAETQMIVTTPEKWDVITRKGGEVRRAAAHSGCQPGLVHTSLTLWKREAGPLGCCCSAAS